MVCGIREWCLRMSGFAWCLVLCRCEGVLGKTAYLCLSQPKARLFHFHILCNKKDRLKLESFRNPSSSLSSAWADDWRAARDKRAHAKTSPTHRFLKWWIPWSIMVLVWAALYSHRLLLLVKYVVTFGSETLLFRGTFNTKGRYFFQVL